MTLGALHARLLRARAARRRDVSLGVLDARERLGAILARRSLWPRGTAAPASPGAALAAGRGGRSC